MSADRIITQPGVSLGTESVTIGTEKTRNYLDIITLIRSIQRAEGNIDCFLKRNRDCDQLNCAWRPYCLGKEGKK
jgi:hypothetical protein